MKPAVIKGEGFNSNGGGFSAIYIDSIRYEPDEVRRAVIAYAAMRTFIEEVGTRADSIRAILGIVK